MASGQLPVTFSFDRSQALIFMTQGAVATSYGYDGSGNLRAEFALPSLALTTYNNDPEDRMNIAQNPDNTRWTYTYSGNGLMRSFVGPSVPLTTLVWDGSDVLQERS